MITSYAHNWWAVGLRGLAAIVFGVLAFIWPQIALTVLVLLFGAYALWDGVFAVIAALRFRSGEGHRWLLFIEGLAGIAAGLITFFYPGITAFVLLYVIAAWAIITGVMEILAAIRLRREIQGEWLLLISGLLSVVFGILLVIFPSAGALAVVWLIAAYAILFGILLIALAFRLRSRVEAHS